MLHQRPPGQIAATGGMLIQHQLPAAAGIQGAIRGGADNAPPGMPTLMSASGGGVYQPGMPKPPS